MSATVLKADLDELVFRARNKEYGSYEMRKKLARSSFTGFIIATVFFIIAMSMPAIISFVQGLMGAEEAAKAAKRQVTYAELSEPPPIDENKPPPPPPEMKLPPPPVKAQVKFVPPEVVKDEKAKPEETIVKIDTFKTNVDAGKKDVEGDPNAIFLTGDVEGTGDAPTEIVEDKEPAATDFVAVEKDPSPVNMDEFKKAVGYPPMMKEAGIQGKVMLRILVDKEGNYVKHVVLRSPHQMLTKAVEEKVRMIKFVPGIQAGKPIKVWVTLPVDFKLRN